MENQDAVLTSLEDYNKDPPETIPTILEEYLLKVASTGETMYAWNKIKKLFVKKMDLVIEEFEKQIPTADLPQLPNVENVNFENMKRRLHNTVNRFDGIPFTIQRLCELLTNPKKHYKRTDKFMRGIEKNLMVVSTVDPFGNKIVNEKQVTTNHAYINGMDPSNGVGANRPDTTPLAPFLPPLNQSPSSTSPFAWFNTQITNLTESAGSVAPWNFTGTPIGSQAEEAKCGEGSADGNRSPQDGDSNSSSSSGLSSEGDSAEEVQDTMSEGMTTSHHTESKNDGEKIVNTRPDRDPNEEPPAKRFKEDDSPDSNEGGQGDIGEIKIQITTAAPDKTVENEAEALKDESGPRSATGLAVSQTPEEVCDRRSSGGFEVTSSAVDESKSEPHRSNSGGFEVTSSAPMEDNKTEAHSSEQEVHSHQSDATASKTLEGQSTDKEEESLDTDKMEEGSCSEAESSAVDMVSNAPSDSDENKSDIDADVNPSTQNESQAESQTEVQSSDDAVESSDSNSKQEVTSSTEQAESAQSSCDNDNKNVTSSENEAASTTPVAEDDNSNQSDDMFFDACSATPEKRGKSVSQSETTSQVLSETQEVDSSSVQAEAKLETPSSQSGETTVSQTDDSSSSSSSSSSEPMDTN